MRSLLSYRPFVLALFVVLVLAVPAFGKAGYPGRPITVICPFTAGGTADSQLRALAAAASREIGQQLIVDNKAGVAGIYNRAAYANEKTAALALWAKHINRLISGKAPRKKAARRPTKQQPLPDNVVSLPLQQPAIDLAS